MASNNGTVSSNSTHYDPVEVASETLRNKIANGDLVPGDRIYEAQLARELGIGRPHVREAARRLERERLLVTKPNFGFLVREMTIGDFEDLIGVRIAVERHAVRLVARQTNVQTVVDELMTIVDEIRRHVENDDVEAEAAADLNFHRAIVVATGNKLLLDIYDELAVEMRISMRLINTTATTNAQDWTKLPQQHELIANKLNDPDTIEMLIEEHISSNWDSAIEEMKIRNRVPLSLLARRAEER